MKATLRDLDLIQQYQDACRERGCGSPECLYRLSPSFPPESPCRCSKEQEPDEFWQGLERARAENRSLFFDIIFSIPKRVQAIHRSFIPKALGLGRAPVRTVLTRLRILQDLADDVPTDRSAYPLVKVFLKNCEQEDLGARSATKSLRAVTRD